MAGEAPIETENEGQGGLLALALLSLLAGAAAGLLAALFRLALLQADAWRGQLLAWGDGRGLWGLLAAVALAAAATALAAWLVRRFSLQAAGSGIPHVEAVERGELPPAPYRLIPVKFVGGVLAIGSGLALGREGPSVQMGASVAQMVGRASRRDAADCRALLAAGAGAGLATAFNAPIAGSIFVLEELVRRFDTRITIVTLGASASAIAVARVLLGNAPDFALEALPYVGVRGMLLFLLLGVLAGFMGVAYNRAIVGTLRVADRLPRCPVTLRAGVIGALVGLVAWYAPAMVGGGDSITQAALASGGTLAALAVIFLVRFALGAVSYAAGTPGGLFAPLLALGAVGGLAYGVLWQDILPEIRQPPVAFAVVGMAAFFTAVVRAPVTGIALVIEMTASFTLLLPMLAACFASMAVARLLNDEPIYDRLRRDLVERSHTKAGDGRS